MSPTEILARTAVCSWSLSPSGPADLVSKVQACGLRAVQLHLDPVRTGAWRCDETAGLLKAARIRPVSGMMTMAGEDYSSLESIRLTGGVRPDATWEANLKAAEGNAIMAMRLGMDLVSFHAGFLPHGGQERETMVERLAEVAEEFMTRNVQVALETGQESAQTLLGVLEEVNAKLEAEAAVGVNFDPANMILYGMGDPVKAVKELMPYVLQVHIKDALPAEQAGAWGTEMPVGQGAVNWSAFFRVLHSEGFDGNFVIEREAGTAREADVIAARDLIAGIGE